MAPRNDEPKTPVALWVLIGVLGLGGAGLFAFGLMQPEGRRNLADPMPLANLAPAPAIPESKPSIRRQIAQQRSEAKKAECDDRHFDCSIACDQYPKKTPGRIQCMAFCNRSRATCMTWSHQ